MTASTVASILVPTLAALVGAWIVRGEKARATFDRRCLIVNALRGGRRLTSIEICNRLAIPTGTIHPDLAALMRGGLIVREVDKVTPVDRYMYRLITDEEASRAAR